MSDKNVRRASRFFNFISIMAELVHIGRNCSAKMCNQLDFLPFICDHCRCIFCLEHRLPFDHECLFEEKFQNVEKPICKGSTRYHCSLPECKQTELIEIRCIHCAKLFCLQHRHQVDHKCEKLNVANSTGQKSVPVVNPVSRTLDNKMPHHFKNQKTAKLAAKVQLMKMKMNAVGNGSIPLSERIYFKVCLPKRHTSKERAFFFSKNWSIGKLVDTIAEMEKLENNNNVAHAEKLLLFDYDGGAHLTMGDRIEDLISKEVLFPGQSLILEYVLPVK